ncbi:MAG: hypothetical protein U0797_26055 [Gemmataceae bacterium]
MSLLRRPGHPSDGEDEFTQTAVVEVDMDLPTERSRDVRSHGTLEVLGGVSRDVIRCLALQTEAAVLVSTPLYADDPHSPAGAVDRFEPGGGFNTNSLLLAELVVGGFDDKVRGVLLAEPE